VRRHRCLTRGKKQTQLKIRAYTTFAMCWLIPRLSSFHTANTGIEVLLTASLDPVDFHREDIDGAIRLGDGKWSGATAFRLVSNILTPVCSSALAKKVRKPAARSLLPTARRVPVFRACGFQQRRHPRMSAGAAWRLHLARIRS
jgi:DNA-binding transcriptional LysR family regulator